MHAIENKYRLIPRFKSAGASIVCVALLGLAGAAGTARGQIITASLEGTIQDGTGSVIPNASVTVVNTSTGVGDEPTLSRLAA